MPGQTPNYSIPYPIAGDSLGSAVQSTPQAAALALDGALGSLAAGGVASGVTNLSLASGSGTVRLYRRGFVGILLFDWTSSGAGLTALTAFATIPAGQRPVLQAHNTVMNFSTGAPFIGQITTGGAVQFRNPVGGVQQMLGSITFPI